MGHKLYINTRSVHNLLLTISTRTCFVFLGVVGLFEESKWLLCFVFGMYAEDGNGCWQPRNRDRHQL